MSKRDHYAEITANIVKMIENGANADHWQMPWHRGTGSRSWPVNAITKHAYKGINVLTLGFAGMAFETDQWATFKQWKDSGAMVRKGETGAPIMYCGWCPAKDPARAIRIDENGDGWARFFKFSHVFNADQVEGADIERAAEPHSVNQRLHDADAFIQNTGAKIIHTGNRAYYRPSTDEITMPDQSLFKATDERTSTQAYYATLCHELTHWTGAKHRLDRLNDREKKQRAFEELIAEIGSAFLGRRLGIQTHTPADHAQYIESWLKVLKSDKRYIFSAASKAQAAVEFVEAMQQAPMAAAA